jgi:hypothetical protein
MYGQIIGTDDVSRGPSTPRNTRWLLPQVLHRLWSNLGECPVHGFDITFVIEACRCGYWIQC